jgi:hypothetical protein
MNSHGTPTPTEKLIKDYFLYYKYIELGGGFDRGTSLFDFKLFIKKRKKNSCFFLSTLFFQSKATNYLLTTCYSESKKVVNRVVVEI